MGRCGCGSACACVVQAAAGSSITVTGNGSSASPYVVGGGGTTCPQVMDCVCANLGAHMRCVSGRLAVAVSGDAGNVIVSGSDGGLMVPASSAGGVETQDTSTVALSGSGLPGDPLTATSLVTFAQDDFCVDGVGQVHVADTGPLVDGAAFTPAAGFGFAATSSQWRRIGSTVHMRMWIRRTGGDLVPPADGDIGTATIGTITAAQMRPTYQIFVSGGNTTLIANVSVTGAGLVQLHTLSKTWPSGGDLVVHAVYLGVPYDFAGVVC